MPIWNEFITLIELGLTTINTLIGNHPAIAIILFTAIIKGLMFPLTMKQLHSSKEMQLVQPKIKELQKKYGKDKQTLTQETMKLYKEHGVNPAAGCLPMLVQLPVFFALYQAILNLSKGAFGVSFLWLPSLAHPDPFFILPVLAMVTQFIQQRMMMPAGAPKDSQTQMTNSMMQFMPVMILIFAWNFSSGAVIYWVASTVFAIVQQYFVTGWGSLFELPLLRRVAPASATATAAKNRQLSAPTGTLATATSGNGNDPRDNQTKSEGGILGFLTRMTGMSPQGSQDNATAEERQETEESMGKAEEEALKPVYRQTGTRPPRKRRSRK